MEEINGKFYLKELTDEWKDRGMKEGAEYAILTDEITKAWAGRSVND